MNLKPIMLALYEIEAIKFGSFLLKSGITSPIYIDLRLIVSYPKLLKEISEALFQKIRGLSFDLICGVPYTALPIASCLSVTHNIPMVMRRKEAKEHGTKKMIEGSYQPGQTCLIIEDLITSGMSIMETAAPLQEVGLVTEEAVVVLDRQQGGKQKLEEKGMRVHSLFTMAELLQTLKEEAKIDEKQLSLL